MKSGYVHNATLMAMLLVLTTSHVYPDTVQFTSGKTVENVTVNLGKDTVTLTYPDGRKESFHPDEIKSTDFSPVVKQSPTASANKIPVSPFRKADITVEKTGDSQNGKQPAADTDIKEPSLKAALQYRFKKIAADIKSTWLKIRNSIGLKLEKTGKKLQVPETPAQPQPDSGPKNDQNNK